jgi:hypothetical protein
MTVRPRRHRISGRLGDPMGRVAAMNPSAGQVRGDILDNFVRLGLAGAWWSVGW